jgi:hypothetical protein
MNNDTPSTTTTTTYHVSRTKSNHAQSRMMQGMWWEQQIQKRIRALYASTTMQSYDQARAPRNDNNTICRTYLY